MSVRSKRVRTAVSPDSVEIFWVSKRGRTETNEEAMAVPARRYFVAHLKASRSGSYWSTLEICDSADEAIALAKALARKHRCSFRVSRRKTAEELSSVSAAA